MEGGWNCSSDSASEHPGTVEGGGASDGTAPGKNAVLCSDTPDTDDCMRWLQVQRPSRVCEH